MRIVPLLAKLSFAAFVLSLAVGLTAALGTRFGLWAFPFGLLKLFPWCLYLGIAGFVVGLVWFVWSRFAPNAESGLLGWIGLLGCIAVLAFPLYNIYVAKSVPPIHDISTDTDHPPQFVAVLPLRAGAMNPPEYEGDKTLMWKGEKVTGAEAQHLAFPDVKTYRDFTTPEKLFDRALTAAKSMGWTIVASDPKAGRIEAYDRTLFFGFTDDIVIQVAQSGQGAKLDIRSKSRVGMSDIGKNAARIRAYLKELATA